MKKFNWKVISTAFLVAVYYCMASYSVPAYAGSMVSIQDTAGRARGLKIADDGSQDVNVQDQYTRILAFMFSEITETGITLAEVPTPGAYTITVEAGHSVTAGERLGIYYEGTGTDGNHIMSPSVVSVATNVLTLDEPVTYAFPIATTIYTAVVDMNTDGSSTTKVYKLTNPFSDPVDITQIIFHLTDATAMDDALFGGMTALTRGIVLRKAYADGVHFENFFNIKDNGEFGMTAGPEGKHYDSKAPAGVYGLTVKYSFSGQSNFGCVIRLAQGDSIQLLVQDNLTTLLSLTGMVEGHFTN